MEIFEISFTESRISSDIKIYHAVFQNNYDIAVSCYFHSYAILVVKGIVTSTNFSWVGLNVYFLKSIRRLGEINGGVCLVDFRCLKLYWRCEKKMD